MYYMLVLRLLFPSLALGVDDVFKALWRRNSLVAPGIGGYRLGYRVDAHHLQSMRAAQGEDVMYYVCICDV